MRTLYLDVQAAKAAKSRYHLQDRLSQLLANPESFRSRLEKMSLAGLVKDLNTIHLTLPTRTVEDCESFEEIYFTVSGAYKTNGNVYLVGEQFSLNLTAYIDDVEELLQSKGENQH